MNSRHLIVLALLALAAWFIWKKMGH